MFAIHSRGADREIGTFEPLRNAKDRWNKVPGGRLQGLIVRERGKVATKPKGEEFLRRMSIQSHNILRSKRIVI